jgi:hypothetical protein
MLLRLLFLCSLALCSSQAYASYHYNSHSSVSMYRSSYKSYKHFSQSVEGGFGNVTFDKGDSSEQNSTWKGMALRSEFGVETLRFFQLSAGFIKADYSQKAENSSVIDQMSGFGEIKIVLTAPMINIEVGGGITGTMMDVITKDGDAAYDGSGVYYTGSISRFLSSDMAIFGRVTMGNQQFIKDSGTLEKETIDIESQTAGIGLKLFF